MWQTADEEVELSEDVEERYSAVCEPIQLQDILGYDSERLREQN